MVKQSKHYNLVTGYEQNMKNTLKHKNQMLQVQVRVPVGNLNHRLAAYIHTSQVH